MKNIFIPPDADGDILVMLEDAMPLLSFLAPVCQYPLLVFAFDLLALGSA